MVMWRRLFVTAVFSQLVQVLVLKIALSLTFADSVVTSIHGIVALYVVLRVPMAFHAASGAESTVIAYAKHVEHAAQMAFNHATHTPAGRARSHPAAS
jgi:hypothetical protein